MSEQENPEYGVCLNCGEKSVIWDNDYSSEDIGYSFVGVVRMYHCTSCDADISYLINLEDKEKEQ